MLSNKAMFFQKLTKKYFLLTIFFLVLLSSLGSFLTFALDPTNTVTLEENPSHSFLV